jgi:hypothetical protein
VLLIVPVNDAVEPAKVTDPEDDAVTTYCPLYVDGVTPEIVTVLPSTIVATSLKATVTVEPLPTTLVIVCVPLVG